MLRKFIEFLFIFFGFILQCSIFSKITLGGVVPNIILIITAFFGFMKGPKEGMYVGFISGLFVDIFFGELFGFYLLLYILMGYLNGMFCSIFYPKDIKMPIVMVTVSDFVYCMICYFFLFLMRGKINFWYYFFHIILRELVYTVIATIALYKPIILVNEFLEDFEIRRG